MPVMSVVENGNSRGGVEIDEKRLNQKSEVRTFMYITALNEFFRRILQTP